MTTFKAALLVLCQLLCLATAVDPTVDLVCNKYAGIATPNGITQWLGLRFAAAPVGSLRFMPPEDPPCSSGTQAADQHGRLCLGTNQQPPSSTTSEDCLFLDVYAPSNATRDSELPVYFFIQGGGFNGLSNPNLNGSGLIEASGHSIVIVTFNYRVGPYGFITNGDEITANNGLRDQRKALQWVKKYISHFGGDPDHVVLGGDSAGAASISLQMVAFDGKKTDLFHAAAAESVSFATVLTVDESQYQYNNFSASLGCVGSDSLSCMRNKTSAQLQSANIGLPYPGESSAPLYMWNPVIDDDFLTDYTYRMFAHGKFVKIPVIYGDDTNGGTIFTPRDTSTLDESNEFLLQQFPYLTDDQLDTIDEMYPNPNDTCPSVGCYWRQVSDAYGDLRYMCPTLFISSAMTQHGVAHSYNYRYNVEDPDQVAQGLGVPHTVELAAIWGPSNVGGGPASYSNNGTNVAVIPVIQAYWTSFIRTFDPNTYRYPGSATWEKWDDDEMNRLLFETGGKTTMESVDEETRSRCEYFADIGVDIRQ
ncbi:alpha/beta-hydrolase [Hypoxylon rubiginosum]|uniref:Alpha/beta-hydrolase n=1 Tax=Hypoxylon rubiginosum TaxID=110542 RepID=A0ACB9ZED5_9PEZI|nr:alpha/beta-hydrolase [Hypoxylon rubiginosum]